MSSIKPSIVPLSAASAGDDSSALARLGRFLVLRRMQELQHGELEVVEAGGIRHRFGRRTALCDRTATLYVESPRFYAHVAFGGSVGAGEAYIHGLWRFDDLPALVEIFVCNQTLLENLEGRWALFSRPFLRLFHFLHRNNRSGSQANIAAHYDLGNALYELMLDETMAYSCGIFEHENATLHEAQIAKFEAICRKLDLKPTDHLCEIGTGWGGLAIHAAQNYGCRVTTTTISREQHDYAQAKIRRLGLEDRITLLFRDYRDLHGEFDKLVSIEMIEAVGADYLDTYFAKCSSLLKRDGAMLLQAITVVDQQYERSLRSIDFIHRFVFPGSFLPSVEAIASSLRRVTDLKMFHLEDIGPHYARTLRLWRERFMSKLPAVRKLGLPDSFIRLWEYYLGYCEGGFASRHMGDVQVLLTKPGCRRPSMVFAG